MPPFNNPPLFEAFCDIERLSHIEGFPKGAQPPLELNYITFSPSRATKGTYTF